MLFQSRFCAARTQILMKNIWKDVESWWENTEMLPKCPWRALNFEYMTSVGATIQLKPVFSTKIRTFHSLNVTQIT